MGTAYAKPLQSRKDGGEYRDMELRRAAMFFCLFASYMIENQKETPQEKPKSTPKVIVIVAHSTSFSIRPKTTGRKWWNGA